MDAGRFTGSAVFFLAEQSQHGTATSCTRNVMPFMANISARLCIGVCKWPMLCCGRVSWWRDVVKRRSVQSFDQCLDSRFCWALVKKKTPQGIGRELNPDLPELPRFKIRQRNPRWNHANSTSTAILDAGGVPSSEWIEIQDEQIRPKKAFSTLGQKRPCLTLKWMPSRPKTNAERLKPLHLRWQCIEWPHPDSTCWQDWRLDVASV